MQGTFFYAHKLKMITKDGEEIFKEGDIYLISPGHNGVISA
jgi:hypothetical protein